MMGLTTLKQNLLFLLLACFPIVALKAQLNNNLAFTQFEGVIAHNVEASCYCEYPKQLLDKQKPLVQAPNEYGYNNSLVKINCFFGDIQPNIKLWVDSISGQNDTLFLQGTAETLGNAYFSTWEAHFTASSLKGYLFVFGKIDSVAFELFNLPNKTLHFDMINFDYHYQKHSTNLNDSLKVFNLNLNKYKTKAQRDNLKRASKLENWVFTNKSLRSTIKLNYKFPIPVSKDAALVEYIKQKYRSNLFDIFEQDDNFTTQTSLPSANISIENYANAYAQHTLKNAYNGQRLESELKFEVIFNHPQVLSMCSLGYFSNEGTQTMSYNNCFSIDLKNKKDINLTDIFKPQAACELYQIMMKATLQSVQNNYSSTNYSNEYEDCDDISFEEDFPENYYLTPNGFVIQHDKYTYFSGSQGVVAIEIAASSLKNIVKPESVAWKVWFQ